MIEVDIQIDRESRRKMQRTLEDFAKSTGKAVEDGIDSIAFSSGRRLVNTVQPFGLKKGDEQIANVGRQIDQSFYFLNAGIISGGSLDDAHTRERRHGKVRLRRQRATDKYTEIASIGELNSYKRKQQAKVGRIKGAWVSAVEAIGKKKMSGIPGWVRRHVPSKFGTCRKSGVGLKYIVELINKVPYITDKLQSEYNIEKAMEEGVKNGIKRMIRVIEKEIEKANRA